MSAEIHDRSSSTPRGILSTARTFAVAALAAVVLVPLSTAVVETAPVVCGFGEASGNGSGGCSSTGSNSARFSFEGVEQFDGGDYFVELTFEGLAPNAGFFVTVTDVPMDEDTFENRLWNDDFFATFAIASSHKLGDYDCIPMVNPSADSSPCRDFVVDAPNRVDDSGDELWTGYDIKLAWWWDSHNNGYNGDGGRAAILHDDSDLFNNYDEDMCIVALTNDAYDECVYAALLDGDPFIKSGDTDFTSFAAVINNAVVPEPASLLLFGAGLSGLIYRQRRRRSSSAGTV